MAVCPQLWLRNRPKQQRCPETASHVNAVCPAGSGLPSECHSPEGRTAGFWARPSMACLIRATGHLWAVGCLPLDVGGHVSGTLPPTPAVLKLTGLTEARGQSDPCSGGRVTMAVNCRGKQLVDPGLGLPQPWELTGVVSGLTTGTDRNAQEGMPMLPRVKNPDFKGLFLSSSDSG